jgi:hypothetical protein
MIAYVALDQRRLNLDRLISVRPEPVEGPYFFEEQGQGFDRLSPNGSYLKRNALAAPTCIRAFRAALSTACSDYRLKQSSQVKQGLSTPP